MISFLYISVGIVAVLTVGGLAISNRASSKLLGKDAFAKREELMQRVQKIQAIGQKLQEQPEGPDAPALRAQFAALNAQNQQEANASLANTTNALRPMMQMNYVVAIIGGIFALGAIGYLIFTQGGPIFIGAGIFIVIMLIYGALGMLRARRAWEFATKDRSTMPPL